MPFSIHLFADACSNLCLYAVEWSVKGNYIALAKEDTLSILSSKFKERSCMALPFKTWISDSDANCIVKGLNFVFVCFSLVLLFYTFISDMLLKLSLYFNRITSSYF